MLLRIIAAVLLVTGYAGLIIPALPGIVLIFAGFAVAAWAENFEYVGWGTLSVLGLLTGLAYLLDAVAGLVGAKRFGAGRSGLVGAAAGTFAGMFFGIPGLVAGPFLGAVAGELLARKDFRSAGLAGLGAWLGLAAGAAVKIAIAFAMAGVFVFVRFL
ncbi:DUF456 domain-containing protein [Chlorobium sp.]|uniref:DUF456 domain-containing protein n=1 Tax=Chlorobium sp. TaxID=1095 RepID=UPI00341E1C43